MLLRTRLAAILSSHLTDIKEKAKPYIIDNIIDLCRNIKYPHFEVRLIAVFHKPHTLPITTNLNEKSFC